MINIQKHVAYLLEGVHERPVEEVTNKELITTGDRGGNVTESHRGTVGLGIGELAASSNDYTDHIKNEGSSIELTMMMLMSNRYMDED